MDTTSSPRCSTRRLIVLCCAVYFASYLTRLDYAAVLVQLVQDLQIPKTTAGIAVTGSFITYGVGMLIFGFCADRIAPRTLIAVGLMGTALINLSMALLPNIYAMVVVWCFNGLFQAMLWPPITRFLAEQLEPAAANDAIAAVCSSAMVANISIYLLSPVLIRVAGWRMVFVAAAVIALTVAAVWLPGTAGFRCTVPEQKERQTGSAGSVGALLLRSALAPLMVGIVLMGMLRDGLQTWMPTYICEVFGLSTTFSIASTTLLPILSLVSIYAASMLLHRLHNEILSGAVLFGVGLVAAAVLYFTFPGSAVSGIAFFALLAGSMHGVNQMIVCSVPAYFARYGRVATFSGLVNSVVYIGASISTYGFAILFERTGWRGTMLIWLLLALTGTVICAFCARRWKRFCYNTPNSQ